MIKLAWRRRTGAGSDSDSVELLGRVVHGATMDSSSMLEGKLACLRSVIFGAVGSCRRSLMTRRGIFSNGVILKVPLSGSLRSTWPASQG